MSMSKLSLEQTDEVSWPDDNTVWASSMVDAVDKSSSTTSFRALSVCGRLSCLADGMRRQVTTGTGTLAAWCYIFIFNHVVSATTYGVAQSSASLSTDSWFDSIKLFTCCLLVDDVSCEEPDDLSGQNFCHTPHNGMAWLLCVYGCVWLVRQSGQNATGKSGNGTCMVFLPYGSSGGLLSGSSWCMLFYNLRMTEDRENKH
jgi:hypothetical protein